MQRTRVKICGITRLEDALDAVALGADALGFVFVESSPRWVKVEQVKPIIEQLPPFVQTVGLFMNQTAEFVSTILQELPLNLLQFHGDEPPDKCRMHGIPYIKALPMGGGEHPGEYAGRYSDAIGFLLDSHKKGQSGGSGDKFDWSTVPKDLTRPLILAGGLTIDNVAAAVKQVRPYAVDVSSGVEAAKGIKDREKMAAFIRGVKQGDESEN